MTHLLTRREAAEKLGVSVSWLAHRAKWGDGPVLVRLGRKVRYLQKDLDEYIEKCRQEEECHSSKEVTQNIGGADSRSKAEKFGGPLARRIAEKLRSKSAGSEPILKAKHLIAVPEDL